MPETPYCPLLSINKDVPVLCQEELCMWYVKQLKLCSLTVLAYSSALNLQVPTQQGQQTVKQPTVAQAGQKQVKPSPKPDEPKQNPFALDDLE